jgi:hypothetical protein
MILQGYDLSNKPKFETITYLNVRGRLSREFVPQLAEPITALSVRMVWRGLRFGIPGNRFWGWRG